MKRQWLSILIILFLSLACLTGFLAWRDSQQASVVLDWSTASEIDTVGFNIYRSERSDRDFSRINTEIIPASQEPLTGGEYLFLDTEVEPGRVYYYLLEDVSMDGKLSRNGPIEVRAKADYWLNLGLSIVCCLLAMISIINWDKLHGATTAREYDRSRGVSS